MTRHYSGYNSAYDHTASGRRADHIASTVTSHQEARKWVINELLPYLRQHGDRTLMQIAADFDLEIMAVRDRVSHARSYVVKRPGMGKVVYGVHPHLEG